MKPIIKYISLLLFSGLILPFCVHPGPNPAPLSAPNIASRPTPATFETLPYIYREIAHTLLPVLTNLK